MEDHGGLDAARSAAGLADSTCPTRTPAPAAPVAPNERTDLVDALRGVALLGILLVNVAWFTQPFAMEFLPPSASLTPLDRVADVAVRFVAETKFYSLFSLLFGFGMAIQMGRAEQRSAAFVPLFLRRMLALFVFGILHVVLMWYGDILHGYAILGCVLLLFRNCKARTLVVWMVVLLLVSVLGVTGVALVAENLAAEQGWPTRDDPNPASAPASAEAARIEANMSPASFPAVASNPFESETEMTAYLTNWAQREIRAFQSGTFAEQLEIRRENFICSTLMLGLLYPNILALFLGGVWIARRGILHSPDQHRGWLKRAAGLGLGIGLPLNAAYAWVNVLAGNESGGSMWLVAIALSFLTGPVLMLGYLASLTLWWQTKAGRACLTPLTFVGRMALSNYLMQSFICSSIFYSHGMGWFGQIGPAQAVGVALLVYAFQVPFSHLWLKRFRFGPMEWLWRCCTYGRMMPMRHPV